MCKREREGEREVCPYTCIRRGLHSSREITGDRGEGRTTTHRTVCALCGHTAVVKGDCRGVRVCFFFLLFIGMWAAMEVEIRVDGKNV